MKDTKRFVIIEEATTQHTGSSSDARKCPFMKGGKCLKNECMMFVQITVKDVENPDGTYLNSGYGRCGLINIPEQSRMFTHYQGSNKKEYFISEIEPEGEQSITE